MSILKNARKGPQNTIKSKADVEVSLRALSPSFFSCTGTLHIGTGLNYASASARTQPAVPLALKHTAKRMTRGRGRLKHGSRSQNTSRCGRKGSRQGGRNNEGHSAQLPGKKNRRAADTHRTPRHQKARARISGAPAERERSQRTPHENNKKKELKRQTGGSPSRERERASRRSNEHAAQNRPRLGALVLTGRKKRRPS